MAVATVRRALRPIHPQSLTALFQTLLHVLRITISFLLLPLDNTILLASFLAGYLPLPTIPTNHRRRQTALRNVHFYPKTVLVTGIDTQHGLAVARAWFFEGHRVIGADVTHLPIRSGASMSRALAAFYHIPRLQYVSRLLDVIHREKVDLWIPCSERPTAMDDAMAKQIVESRTDCKCLHLDTELSSQFDSTESFMRFLVERDLPVVENHQVLSRDSVHRILHRSPSKSYHMRRAASSASLSGRRDGRVVVLPKRTVSMTYSELSEIKISKDVPWVLEQQNRLGKFVAEMLVVRGNVEAIKIRPVDGTIGWGKSRLDEALATAIHRVMERFATKGGSRLTGHLSVKLLVDEEFDANSVRHVIHIASCAQGVAAVQTLLQEPSSLIPGYLSMLLPINGNDPRVNSTSTEMINITSTRAKAIMYVTPREPISVYETVKRYILRFLPRLQPILARVDELISEAVQFLFWKDLRFLYLDPLPSWWHVHVYQPLIDVGRILQQRSNGKRS